MSLVPLVFAPTVDALFIRGLGPQLSPRCRERLLAEGLDLDRPLEASYLLTDWKRWLRTSGAELYPGRQRAEALQGLGRSLAAGLTGTPAGGAALTGARAYGQRHSLLRLGQSLRAGSNFSEVRLTELAPGHWEVWLNEVLADDPSFMVGLLLEHLALSGGRGLAVVPQGFRGTSCTFHARWVEVPGVSAA